jgi:GlpG protein
MRMIGHLGEESLATIFGNFLHAEGIENQVEQDDLGQWCIWVHDDDQLEMASRMLTQYRANPADPIYHDKARAGAKLKSEAERMEENYRHKLHDRAELTSMQVEIRLGLLTTVLMAGCMMVFVVSNFGADLTSIRSLFISQAKAVMPGVHKLSDLVEIRQGEVWRLFTPMLIHLSILHIVFNMLWLRDLGSIIEWRLGSGHLAVLVLCISGISNLAQFLWSGPAFGGMSGVVYGLLGYAWIRGRFDPGSALRLHPTTVWMMLIWFFLCLTDLAGHIANVVHAVGLGMGMAWGYVASLAARR